jgi:hypothetical protein
MVMFHEGAHTAVTSKELGVELELGWAKLAKLHHHLIPEKDCTISTHLPR